MVSTSLLQVVFWAIHHCHGHRLAHEKDDAEAKSQSSTDQDAS
eukprot:03723.XXX_48998_49126_1 [CDS] Oithona nana genome sequencing.